MADKNYPLRLPEELYEEVKNLAEDDERSVNAQIIVLLREAIKARKQNYPKANRQPNLISLLAA